MESRKLKKLFAPLLFICSVTLFGIAVAVDYGQIKGVVTDRTTGAPIVGASVQLVGTDRGAITDDSGRYVIRSVEPGVYDLQFTSVGYAKRVVKGIRVHQDLTAESNVALSSDSQALENVQVYGEKVIDKYEVSAMTKITNQTIQCRLAPHVNDALNRVSGVVKSDQGETRIRGGRAGEIAYIVDGVTIRNPSPGAPPIIGAKTVPPSHGGSAIVNGEPFDAMFFKNYGVNPFVDVDDDSLSTFAFDVDDASYTLARSYLAENALPNKDAVRTEEFVNHFVYNYDSPKREAFSVSFEGAPSQNKRNSVFLRIGVQGRKVADENRKSANLTFVIDVSGSMDSGNRLGLVKRALKLLVDELQPNDKVGIVVYGSRGHVVLEPTTIAYRDVILAMIASLHTEGATNTEEGIRLGYNMAQGMFEKDKINRVILCSDGVANVGTTGPDAILEQIRQYAKQGITLSTVGFGMGNYNDILMERLGDKGDGHYAYVDDISAARKVFVDNLTGTLQVIARDVKAQMVFNPAVVRSYRLLGYENRDVADEDFRVDTVDGGEVGSGHQVTVLYEVKLKAGDSVFDGAAYPTGELGELYIRYEAQEGKDGAVTEIKRAVELDCIDNSFASSSTDYRLAVCAANFAEILRDSYWARGYSLSDELHTAQALYEETGDKDIKELAELIQKTIDLQGGLAKK